MTPSEFRRRNSAEEPQPQSMRYRGAGVSAYWRIGEYGDVGEAPALLIH
jgi:hypothetical protein